MCTACQVQGHYSTLGTLEDRREIPPEPAQVMQGQPAGQASRGWWAGQAVRGWRGGQAMREQDSVLTVCLQCRSVTAPLHLSMQEF